MNAIIVEVSGYGRMAIEDGKVGVAQTGRKYGVVPGKAVGLASANDWDGLFKLYRRSPKLRMAVVKERLVEGGRFGWWINLYYGSASLVYVAIPDAARHTSIRDAWRSIGVEMPGACGSHG